LRADIPRVPADDRFIAVLADLAASSTPASDRSRVSRTALRVKIAAVTASVALVSVGAAYAVGRFGGDERAPVGPTDTVEPASPSEPGERYEQQDGDLAPHDLDEGPETHSHGGATKGDEGDPGLQDNGVEGRQPVASAPQDPAGHHDAEQNQSDPQGSDPEGGAAPDPDPTDSSGHGDNADTDPDVDPDDPDTDAEASGAEEPDAGQGPETDRDRDVEVD
jgi:hypothetical protein